MRENKKKFQMESDLSSQLSKSSRDYGYRRVRNCYPNLVDVAAEENNFHFHPPVRQQGVPSTLQEQDSYSQELVFFFSFLLR